MDDLAPGPSTSFAWQDLRSLDAIRDATTGRTRAEALSVYLVLTEGPDEDGISYLAERAGVSELVAKESMRLFGELGLLKGETLVT